MVTLTIEKVITQLQSGVLQDQGDAITSYLQERHSIPVVDRERIAESAVDALEASENRYIFCEMIGKLGNELDKYTLERFRLTEDQDLKAYLAAILLIKGNDIGEGVLLNEVAIRSDKLYFVSGLLSAAKNQDLAPKLIDVLSNIPLGGNSDIPTTENDYVTTLLSHLKRVKEEFPEELASRFKSTTTPKIILDEVNELWPQ